MHNPHGRHVDRSEPARIRAFLQSLILFLGICSYGSSLAFEIDAPLFTNGDYTVSYTECLSHPSTVYCRLEEREGIEGDWTSVATSPTMSVTFTAKPEGEYYYRVHQYIFYIEGPRRGGQGPIIIHNYGAEARVVVQHGPVPVPGTIEEQLHYTYETRIGHINGDASLDIFLSRTSGGVPLDGSIDDVILENVGDGTFTLVVPTTAQILEAESWQEVAIALILDDLNADGFLDVFLKGVGSFVSGALDQMIYSPGQVYSPPPKGLRAVDSDFTDFVEDSFAWYVDDDYVSNATVWVPDGHWEVEIECEFIFMGDTWEWYCFPSYEWVEDEPYPTYPGIHSDVADMWEAFQAYEEGQGEYAVLRDILEEVLGVEIGSIPTCDEIYDGDFPEIPGDVVCDGTLISRAIAAIWRSMLESIADPDRRFGRETGHLHITAHKPFVVTGPWHTAIEYRDPISGTASWVSAYCDLGFNVSCISGGGTGTGLLVSGTGFTDRPVNNILVATVVSALPADQYYADILSAKSRYQDCLEYAGIPERTPFTDYNSNGWVAAIVEYTGGLFDFSNGQLDKTSMSDFFGGSVPVPSIEFSEQPPACP